MSQSESSSRGLIRSMMVIGSSNGVKIIISIARMKILAMLVGPAGIGLLSIYNNLQGMVSQAAGLGMRNSGVREIASTRGEDEAFSRVRRVLMAAHLVQGILAMVGMWVLRAPVAEWLLDDPDRATEVGLVGIAILFTLMASAQTALLQGLRRIGDLGRVTVLGALVGTVAGLAAVWFQGNAGLIWFVLAQPFTAFIVSLLYIRRLPTPSTPRLSLAEIWEIWKPMARLGAAFMLGGLATAATLLLVRGKITQDLGLDAAGQFAASWGIAMTYVGFLLGAMGADYYPRLTEVVQDREAAGRLINDQVQLGMAIGGPVLLLLIGLAPWVIELLYSPEFAPAATLLQWQIVGNVFKIPSWALSFLIVAASQAKTYIITQLAFNVLFLALIWLLMPLVGLVISGVAFMLAYVGYFFIVNYVAHVVNRFRWQRLSLGLLLLHVALAVGLLVLALQFQVAAAVAAPILAAATGILGLRIVLEKIGPGSRITRPLTRAYAAAGWPIRSVS